jgi:hypothetical protein
VQLHEFCIPVSLGKHYTEKPEIELCAFEDDREGLPAFKPDVDTEALEQDLVNAQRRLKSNGPELSQVRQELQERTTRCSILGCSLEEAQEVLQLQQRQYKLSERLDATEREIAALEAKIERAGQTIEVVIDGRCDALKKLAYDLGQYDLLDSLSLQPEYYGQTRFTHGLAAEKVLIEFIELVRNYTNCQPQDVAAQVRDRPELQALIEWAAALKEHDVLTPEEQEDVQRELEESQVNLQVA